MSGERKKIHVAVSSVDGAGWTGGGIYFQNLVASLHSLGDDQRPEISLLIPAESDVEKYRNFKPYVDHFLCLPPVASRTLWTRVQGRVGAKMRTAGLAQNPLGPYLREHGVDCLYTMGDQGPQFRFPLLSWIYDFQHLHLPEMCSVEEIEQRNLSLHNVAKYGTRVMLSSQTAKDDLQRFAPQSIDKARVLRFVAQVPDGIYESEAAQVCERYSLPKRFFYLPNQFWKHKNHKTVIEALQSLKKTHPEITVVCTGNTSDYRNPQYFAQLLTLVSEHNLRDNFIVLGLVPHAHIFELMRQSLAVLQPSLFEGWSTTVEEAKSVGKRMLLSDIPVHREQNPPKSLYFDPRSAKAMATVMADLCQNAVEGPDFDLEATARQNLKPRTNAFAVTFLDAAYEAIAQLQ